jgi:hypothetical protein
VVAMVPSSVTLSIGRPYQVHPRSQRTIDRLHPGLSLGCDTTANPPTKQPHTGPPPPTSPCRSRRKRPPLPFATDSSAVGMVVSISPHTVPAETPPASCRSRGPCRSRRNDGHGCRHPRCARHRDHRDHPARRLIDNLQLPAPFREGHETATRSVQLSPRYRLGLRGLRWRP